MSQVLCERANDAGGGTAIGESAPSGHAFKETHGIADTKPRVLLVDDEAVILAILKEFLEFEGMTVVCAGSAEQAIRLLEEAPYDLVLTDLKMPGIGGLQLLRHVRGLERDTECVIMTGFGTVETAIEAMKHGAVDYILKPFKPDEVVQVLQRVIARQRLERENFALRELMGIYELSEALSSAMPLDDQLQMIVSMVQENFGADGVSVWVNDPRHPGSFACRSWIGPLHFEPRTAAIFAALECGHKVNSHGDEVVKWMVAPRRADGEVSACMAAPLRFRGASLGILHAYSLRRGHVFGEGQRKGLTILSSRAADALETARMYGDLQETFTQTIEGFARALEAKDTYTHGHSDRVAIYSKLIATTMGLPAADIERIKHGGLMHDIGKIGIRSMELNKPQKLTPVEHQMFKSHPVQGRRIIEPIRFLGDLIPCVYHHHEAWDGSGYPAGLDGVDIPIEARILAVADSYDAMTSNRPYRKALPHDIALVECRRCVRKQFDPHVVEAFLQVIADFRRDRRAQGLPVPE